MTTTEADRGSALKEQERLLVEYLEEVRRRIAQIDHSPYGLVDYDERADTPRFLHCAAEVVRDHDPDTCQERCGTTGLTDWSYHLADLVMTAGFDDAEQYVYEVNNKNGWHEEERHPMVGHDLLHTEISEASEAFRDWGLDDMTGKVDKEKALLRPDGRLMPKPLGVGSEYADNLVRQLDTTKRTRGPGQVQNLWWEFKRKMAFNNLRGWKHGGKSI